METYLRYLGVDGAKDESPPTSSKQPLQSAAPAAPVIPAASETSVARLPGPVTVANPLQVSVAKDQLKPMRLPRADEGVGETRVDYVVPPMPAAALEKPAPKAKDPVKPKLASKLVGVAPAAAPARKNSVVLIVAAVVVCGLGIGVWALPLLRGNNSSPSPVSAPAPVPRPLRAATVPPSSALSPSVEKCLRLSSQTINSQERDALLRQIVEDVDTGKHAQALADLRRYTAEACDRATLEAIEILGRQHLPRHKN